ncbi:M6 family metalloprotease [Amniculicola lignicola CBS 123094]|uniref:M6 family metalloprotease n=1 Tax=Amniculicola lignicola CBS 123094 TaxID=1392246 RepID=A0A6A5WF82_9PLEO|nr:M6 family metalloprotease [Amniculicola lignicola CBS 123094]
MLFSLTHSPQRAVSTTILASAVFSKLAFTAPSSRRAVVPDAFAILDKQNWVNPADMTWDDYVQQPGNTYNDPAVKGTIRNFNIAMVTVDYDDKNFTITLPPNSDIFGNPQPSAANYKREDVPAFYRDLLNKPQDLNHGHTMHEYWKQDSYGKFGVDLTVFGAYRLPSLSWQYGIDDVKGGFNPGACPEPGACSVDLRTDALGAWRAEIGDDAADAFELVFILSAGQDESSTWQEFGEMKFVSPEAVTDEFGPPINETLPNWAHTRYVNWTSWASASSIWPNAGGGSSTQAESSGMATFAHELSHLLGIGDNYNNPYGTPERRAYSGPFSMLDRGSFNGPGGPHSRWQIPPVQGASMGSLHTVRDKIQIGLATMNEVLQISSTALATSGLVVAEVIARSVDPGDDALIGLNITMPSDRSPACNTATDPLCDGGGYPYYNMEVIDRMGADSFIPDSGVMLSKSKRPGAPQPFQWVVDANPQDIHTVDFVRPNGTAKYYTIGDYRQLADALFHAGTRSGSQYEFIDTPNRLHFYILDRIRDSRGVLKYNVGVRSLDGSGSNKRAAELDAGKIESGYKDASKGVLCSFKLKNSGDASKDTTGHPQDLTDYLRYDIYRLNATTDSKGWIVEVPNALTSVKVDSSHKVYVAVKAGKGAVKEGIVKLTVTSESDPNVQITKTCKVKK